MWFRTAPRRGSLAEWLAELFDDGHPDDQVGASPEAFVFAGLRGGALRHSAFYGRIRQPTLRALGLPAVGLYVLRHSAAGAMISAGASPKTVQTVLGHRSAAFALTVYGHMYDADLDALAGRLDVMLLNNARPARGLAV